MAERTGVSGVAVTLVGAAALLIYAGLRGVNPVGALRDIASGTAPGFADQASVHQALYTGITGTGEEGGGGGTGVVSASLAGGTHPEIVTAAGYYAHDRYSQVNRWATGYSDCSSFVGKALKRAGITPPAGSVTGSYLVWNKLKTISRGQIGAGDLLCGTGHIAIAMSPTMAIGQQNGRTNVQMDSIDTIMWGQAGWIPRRYVGTTSRGGGGSAAA